MIQRSSFVSVLFVDRHSNFTNIYKYIRWYKRGRITVTHENFVLELDLEVLSLKHSFILRDKTIPDTILKTFKGYRESHYDLIVDLTVK